MLGADVPMLLRKGALDTLGGHLDFSCDVLTLRELGLGVPLRVNQIGHFYLGVVAPGEERSSAVRGTEFPSAYFAWASVNKRPNLSDGSMHLPFTGDGLYRFEPLQTFSACKAVTSGDARGGRLADPNKIITRMHRRDG